MVNVDDPNDGGRRARAVSRRSGLCGALDHRRARRRGCRSAHPTTTGSGPTAQDLDMPLSMHTATDRAIRRVGDAAFRLDVKHVPPSVFINKDYQVRQSLADLIFTGVFERYPGLRVGAVEHELAWIPYFLDQMDYTYTDRPPRGDWHRFPSGVLPSDYFRRNCFASFQEDAVGIRVRDVIGVDTLMWGSDYPHTESTFPRSQEILCDILDGRGARRRAQDRVATNAAEPLPLRSAAARGRTPDDRPRDPGRHRRRRQRRAGVPRRRRHRRRPDRRDRRRASPATRGGRRRRARSWCPASSTSTRTTTRRRCGTPSSRRRSFHGVTSVVAGNCGYSLAPTRPADRASLCRTLDKVEDMRLATLEAGIEWDFETYPEYLAAVHRRGTAINFGGYVGHTAVRMYVMGDDAYEREATDDEIDADASGRGGVDPKAARSGSRATAAASTSATAAGRCRRSSRPRTRSRRSCASPARSARASCTSRPGENFAWVYDFQRTLGPHDHLVVDPHLPAGVEVARAVPRQARAPRRGPRRGRRRVGAGHVPADPPGARDDRAHRVLLGARVRAVRRRAARGPAHVLRRPGVAARVSEEFDSSKWVNPRWETFRVADSDAHPELVGRSVADIAAERGCHRRSTSSPTSSLADDLESRFSVTFANDEEDGVSAPHAHRRLHHGAVRCRCPRRARSATR